MLDRPSYIRIGIGCMIAITAMLNVTPRVAFAESIPDGVTEYVVDRPDEISGVAATRDGFVVIGDGVSRHYYSWPDGRVHRVWSEDKGRVCDGESIEVGYGDQQQRIRLYLGEDFAKVYVEAAPAIQLPRAFLEQCGRGAEGMSVKWSDNGWDLAVLWEGGYYSKKHEPNNDKKKSCKQIEEVACTKDRGPHNALVALYWLSADAKAHKLERVVTLQTKGLRDDRYAGERFRATDIAWYGDELLVLLGSTPKFKLTWIQGFGLDGKPIQGRRLEMEDVWPEYRKGKNWEALDTTLDGRRLILGYDTKGPSEIIVFEPKFE